MKICAINERFGSSVFGELKDIDQTVGDFRFQKVSLKCCIFSPGKDVICERGVL